METQAALGLVIRERRVSESDRLITVLTDKAGVIKAFVPNALKINSKFLSATQLLSCSKMYIKPSKDNTYRISDAKPVNVFFGLRQDISLMALAGYMCELIEVLAPSGEAAPEFLSVALNSLFALSEKMQDKRIVKAVFELKFCSYAGYMPDLTGCCECGNSDPENAVFNVGDGVLCCSEHGNGMAVSKGVLSAMRHIIDSDAKRAFSFSLSERSLDMLCRVCEKFVLAQTDRRFKTLDFYKQI